MPILKPKLLLLTLIIFTFLVGCASPQTGGVDPTALPYTPKAPAGEVAQAPEVTEGDPTAGKVVFEQYCANCHSVEKAVALVGPSLFQAGARLQISFIAESIRHPLDYINPAYQETGMPEAVAEVLSPQEFNDLVSFVASLR